MALPLAIRIALWTWLLAALAVGRSEILARVPLFVTPAILAGLTALLVLAYRWVGTFRAWVGALDLRSLVLFHITRFSGFYFLVLFKRDELPYAFAVPGGLGDILVALLALVVVFVPFSEFNRNRFAYLWNVIGFIDLLLVFVTATRIACSADSYDLIELTRLPLSLLPTFLAPLLLASHLAIFARLKRAAS